jgi:hypothetical protein
MKYSKEFWKILSEAEKMLSTNRKKYVPFKDVIETNVIIYICITNASFKFHLSGKWQVYE